MFRVISLFTMKILRAIACCVGLLMLPSFAGALSASEMVAPMEIDHVALQVKDVKKSVAFYGNVMGLEQLPEPFHDGLHAWMRLGLHVALHLIGEQRA
jgi:lactoylglutathione lyase